MARGAGGRAVLGSGLFFHLLPGAALSNNVVTSHTELFKFKAENSVPHSDEPHFKCSTATGDYYNILDIMNAEYVHHYKKFYWTVLFWKSQRKGFLQTLSQNKMWNL